MTQIITPADTTSVLFEDIIDGVPARLERRTTGFWLVTPTEHHHIPLATFRRILDEVTGSTNAEVIA